jgi:hypothetical protein
VSGPAAPEDFLSGTSGLVFGVRATSRALARDALADAGALARGWPWRLARAASASPRRRVLVLAVERTSEPNILAAARRELGRSRHEVRIEVAAAGDRGKFENLNALLANEPASGYDWLLVVDDDVVLPAGFLGCFLFLAERFAFELAQPAHRRRSHAAWAVTRRRRGSVVRQTPFVEIGPVFAFHAPTFATLLPFPSVRMGWGLDVHWSAVAQEHGWPMGVIDATPIRHGLRPIAASYDRATATEEAQAFLAERPYTRAHDAQRTLALHRTWRR